MKLVERSEYLKFVLSGILLCAATAPVSAEIILIYTEVLGGSDRNAKAVLCRKVERFPQVTNATTTEGGYLQLRNGQVKEVILKSAPGISRNQVRTQLTKSLKRYPRTKQLLETELALLGPAPASGSTGSSMRTFEIRGANLKIGERSLENARVTSFRDGKVGIVHKTGSLSIDLKGLSDADFEKLQRISAVKLVKPKPPENPPSTKLQAPNVVTMPEKSPEKPVIVEAPPIRSTHDISKIKRRAEEGDTLAQVLYSRAFALCLGVPMDSMEAYYWGRKSMEAGDLRAAVWINAFREDGKATAEQLEGLREKGEEGDPWSFYFAGYAHYLGLPGERNLEQAVELLQSAADELHDARSLLGLIFLEQSAKSEDRELKQKGIACLEEASWQNDPLALLALGRIRYSQAQSPDARANALNLVKRAADFGWGPAQFEVAQILAREENRHVPGKLEEGRTFLETAAANRYPPAMKLLAKGYMQAGNGRDEASSIAKEWENEAAKSGYVEPEGDQRLQGFDVSISSSPEAEPGGKRAMTAPLTSPSTEKNPEKNKSGFQYQPRIDPKAAANLAKGVSDFVGRQKLKKQMTYVRPHTRSNYNVQGHYRRLPNAPGLSTRDNLEAAGWGILAAGALYAIDAAVQYFEQK